MRTQKIHWKTAKFHDRWNDSPTESIDHNRFSYHRAQEKAYRIFSNEALPRGVKSAVSCLSLDLLKKRKENTHIAKFCKQLSGFADVKDTIDSRVG